MMIVYRRICKNSGQLIRKYVTRSKQKIELDQGVQKGVEDGNYKPRKHPGVITVKTVSLPDKFVAAAVNVLADHPVKQILLQSKGLVEHLRNKVPPMEQEEINEKISKVRERVMRKYKDVIIKDEKDEKLFQQKVQQAINNILNQKIYNWKPVKYDMHTSLLYLLGRSAADYAVLVKIFSEIKQRDPNFVPRSLFDFGSGVGTVTWAANTFWKGSLYEYFNVDASGEMNELAQILLQGGRGNAQSAKGVYYRQFLPASQVTYDLVVSAYTLLELPSLQTRLETIVNLWNKTHKYLVVVENGTNAGFKVVNEVRDFILSLKPKVHIFSPCPHDYICPRFIANDGTPCNFQVGYSAIPISQKSEVLREKYSYVVFKKDFRSDDDPQWPRVVREALVKSKHTICRMCTAEGKLEEVIFTAAKHGKTTYHCARSTKWGDLLPINMELPSIDDRSNDKK